MRPHLNLATRVYINRRQVNLVMGGSLLLLAIVLAAIFGKIIGVHNEIRRAEAEATRLDARLKKTGTSFTDKEYAALLERITAANGVIQRKTTNWIGILNHLEEVLPNDVAIVSVQPDSKNGTLKIGAAATRFANLRQTVENFQESKIFRDVLLLDHVMVKEQDIVTGFTFTLSCRVDFQSL